MSNVIDWNADIDLTGGLVEGLRKAGVIMTNTLTEMPKVGERVRYVGESDILTTYLKVYTVIRHDEDGLALFMDDENNPRSLCEIDHSEFGRWVLITDAYTPGLPVVDNVDSPSHYTNGKFETIEVIEEITQGYTDGFVAHCAGTAIKYIARAPYKHETPLEDLRKAAKYLEFAIKRLESQL